MKKTATTALIIITFIAVFATVELRPQSASNSRLGLTFGLDYISNYMTRGQYGFGASDEIRGGYFFPSVSFDVFGSGLSLEVRGEVHESGIGGSDEDKAYKTFAKYLNCVDFNVNYAHGIENIITFDFGVWYYRYRNIPITDMKLNYSYFDFYLSAVIKTLPLRPKLAATYSHFQYEETYRGGKSGNGKNGDFYFQFDLGHSFELAASTHLDISVITGFYHKRAMGAKSPDISDIDISAGISTTRGIVTLAGSFHYIIVPGTQFKYLQEYSSAMDEFVFVKDIHRFYARFGASVSI